LPPTTCPSIDLSLAALIHAHLSSWLLGETLVISSTHARDLPLRKTYLHRRPGNSPQGSADHGNLDLQPSKPPFEICVGTEIEFMDGLGSVFTLWTGIKRRQGMDGVSHREPGEENFMSDRFSEMDRWTSEEVALFKKEGKNRERSRAGDINGKMIIAEGDSWFDYLPGTDIIDCLRNHYGYRIDNSAKAGDTLENMIYGTAINKRFEPVSPTIKVVLRQVGLLKPRVFLFSGGGNDVAGEEFESYLNHHSSGLPPIREQYLKNMIDVVFRKYLEDLIGMVASASPRTHIVVHGYGHTVPTGEGVDLLFFTFAGPWLKPALARKGILNKEEQRRIVFRLIDAYNEMLLSLDHEHEPFHFVDLRSLIDPERDWANELHLRNSAYARVAGQIHEVIQSL
jgi:hypothetical protein